MKFGGMEWKVVGKCDGCGAWNSGKVGANRWKYQVWGVGGGGGGGGGGGTGGKCDEVGLCSLVPRFGNERRGYMDEVCGVVQEHIY